MFNMDFMVDAVQNSKKTFIKTFVTNEKIATSLNDFVDSQTAYTKDAVKATTAMMTNVLSETSKSMQDLTKFDYAKFGEGIMKAYYSHLNTK